MFNTHSMRLSVVVFVLKQTMDGIADSLNYDQAGKGKLSTVSPQTTPVLCRLVFYPFFRRTHEFE